MATRNKVNRKTTCSKCNKEKERPNHSYCNACFAEWAREHRPKHSSLPDEQRKKANARSYLNVYIRRGKIEKGPCYICGTTENIEAHHHDYDKPLEVIWHCRQHHLNLHYTDPVVS